MDQPHQRLSRGLHDKLPAATLWGHKQMGEKYCSDGKSAGWPERAFLDAALQVVTPLTSVRGGKSTSTSHSSRPSRLPRIPNHGMPQYLHTASSAVIASSAALPVPRHCHSHAC